MSAYEPSKMRLNVKSEVPSPPHRHSPDKSEFGGVMVGEFCER